MRKRVGRNADLSSINEIDIERFIKNDINRQAGIKCQALLSLKNNVSISDVCKVLGVTRESVRLWRKTLEKDGPDGFVKYHKTGRISKLTPAIEDFIKASIILAPSNFGYHQSIWDGKLLCKLLLEKQNTSIGVRAAQNWLKKIGFSRQTPRKKLKQGCVDDIDAFKKKSNSKHLN